MCDAARPQPLGQSNFVLLRNTPAHTISKRPTICQMNLLRGKLRSNGPLMCADLIFRVSDIAKLLAKTNFPQQAKYIHFSKLVREWPLDGRLAAFETHPFGGFFSPKTPAAAFVQDETTRPSNSGGPHRVGSLFHVTRPLCRTLLFFLFYLARGKEGRGTCASVIVGVWCWWCSARVGGLAGNLLSRRLLSSCTGSHNSSKVNPCRRRVARANRNTGCLTPQAAQRRRRRQASERCMPEKTASARASTFLSVVVRQSGTLFACGPPTRVSESPFCPGWKEFPALSTILVFYKKKAMYPNERESSLCACESPDARSPTGVLMNSISPVSQSGLSWLQFLSLAHSFRPGATMMRPFVDLRRRNCAGPVSNWFMVLTDLLWASMPTNYSSCASPTIWIRAILSSFGHPKWKLLSSFHAKSDRGCQYASAGNGSASVRCQMRKVKNIFGLSSEFELNSFACIIPSSELWLKFGIMTGK